MKFFALFGSAAFAVAVSFVHLAPAAPGVVKPNPNPTCPPPIVQLHGGPAVSSLHYCPQ